MTKQPPQRIHFTKGALDALSPPESGRCYVYDAKAPGLCLCVTSTGAKTFYCYYKSDGKPRRYRIGAFPSISVENARDAAKKLAGKIADGRDPHMERIAGRKRPTLRDLWEHWLETHAKLHKRTWRDDERQFYKYLGEFHDRRLDSIRTADVAAWHGRMGKEHGPVQANRTLALLGACLEKQFSMLRSFPI